MVQVNQVCLKILFINRLQFLVDSNDVENIYIFTKPDILVLRYGWVRNNNKHVENRFFHFLVKPKSVIRNYVRTEFVLRVLLLVKSKA